MQIITVNFYDISDNVYLSGAGDLRNGMLAAEVENKKDYRYNTCETFAVGDTALVQVPGHGLKLVKVVDVEAVEHPAQGLKYALARVEYPAFAAKVATERARKAAKERLNKLRDSYSDVALLETLFKAGLIDHAEHAELRQVLS